MTFNNLVIAILVTVLLSLVISSASFFLGTTSPDKEKASAYECGFNPFDIRCLFYIIELSFACGYGWDHSFDT